ncbi:MAG: Yip1 domain protein [Verrucomicrobiales bacterium]|nr:Yip1 domain protein [Verrucomicrobiales bacterium]
MIHVNRSGTNLGTFSEEDVRAGLRAGRFLSSDLGWREGMAQWQPLSQFSEFAAEAAVPTPPPIPDAGIATVPADPALPAAAVFQPRTGLPWEHREQRGFFNAFIDTLSIVLTKPGTAFSMMRTEGGFGGPLLYAIIGGGAGVIVWFAISLLLNSLGIMGDRENTWGPMIGMSVSSMIFVWRLAAVALAPFIFAGLVHLSLMLLGGAKKTFETTFRVIAFAQGSTAPLQLVPCCGVLACLVWNLVANCIGIARAHEIDTGRATLAVFLPLIVCCGGSIFLLFMFGGLAALGHNWNQ